MPISLNLLADAWLPMVRASGRHAILRPAEVAGADDPALAPDWPRPDFRIATLEFLVGLLATACPPADQDAWLAWWEEPPTPETLDAAFAPLAHAFVLDGDGPRFLQDRDDLAAEAEPIERLLIEAPGASTTAKNTDLLVRRGRVGTLGRAAAAIALYAFQSWAPAGGAGNRTGLRGGGPLLTLVVPRERYSLWHLVWANVPVGRPAAPADLPRVFPWLAPTITSEGTRVVTPDGGTAHPLQAFWGMPRRIRLDFAVRDTLCDLTGAADAVAVTGWRQRPRGPNYDAWGLRHPLTPHYQPKAGGEWLPVHPQPGGIGYRHWLGLVLNSPDGARRPAAAVAVWHESRARGGARLLAAGYDMDNMKARAFVESEMPLPAAAPPQRERLDDLARRLVLSADLAATLLRQAVRAALFAPGAAAKADAELFSALRERLWERTEGPFFAALHRAADPAADPLDDAEERAWAKLLRATALALFDEAAPLDPQAAPSAAARTAKARRALGLTFAGYGRDGRQLFQHLDLPLPQRAKEAA